MNLEPIHVWGFSTHPPATSWLKFPSRCPYITRRDRKYSCSSVLPRHCPVNRLCPERTYLHYEGSSDVFYHAEFGQSLVQYRRPIFTSAFRFELMIRKSYDSAFNYEGLWKLIICRYIDYIVTMIIVLVHIKGNYYSIRLLVHILGQTHARVFHLQHTNVLSRWL